MLFYKKVVALDMEVHRHIRFKRESFGFAQDVNSVILTGSEFAESSKEYPIAFVQAQNGDIVSVALLGVREGENLYVDDSGKWNARYIPAYVRRYPFIFSETGPDRLTVCIDETCPDLNDDEGEALFDKTGEASPLLGQLVEFMQGYQADLLRTQAFVERLKQHDLLKETEAMLKLNTGAEYVVKGIMMIDEQKLASLDDAVILGFFKSGELAWIYAHLLSLSNLNRQVDLLSAKKPLQLQ